MTIRDRSALRAEADRRVREAAYSPRRLVLIHTGVVVAVSLVIALLNYLLAWQVDANTGGLSGMQLRSVLETASTVLRYAYSIAMPFWSIGLTFALLRIARGQDGRPESLLEGFRRFGPVLRLRLIQVLLYSMITTVCMYVGILLFMVTPFAQSMIERMEPLLLAETVEQMENAMLQLTGELMPLMLPAFVICLLICAVVLIPLAYRLRMADFVVMDQPGTGALASLMISSRIMKGNRFQMFRLDLHFWWYYLLTGLVAMLAYADQLLPALGVTLPVSETVAFFGAYVLYILATLALNWWLLHRVETTYAVAYDTLLQQLPQVPVQQPASQNVPWDYPVEKEE